MIITQGSPNQADIIAMLEKLDAYFGELYPAESNHLMDVDSLMHPDVTFLVARDERGSGLKLETGAKQLDAIGLYQRDGFTPCAPFGAYQLDPLSIFMERPL